MGTYKDFLQMIGMSHQGFLVLLLVGFFILSIIMFLSKLGFLSSIKFKHTTLPPCRVVYTCYEGSYDLINTKVQEVLTDSNQFFKMSDLFGIYYERDDTDPDKQQASLGILVQSVQYQKIQPFIKKFGGKYKEAKLPLTACVGTKYPYFNSTSLIMIVNRVYPRLGEFVKQKRLEVGPGIMEVYRLLDKSPYVQILAPMQNMDSFVLK